MNLKIARKKEPNKYVIYESLKLRKLRNSVRNRKQNTNWRNTQFFITVHWTLSKKNRKETEAKKAIFIFSQFKTRPKTIFFRQCLSRWKSILIRNVFIFISNITFTSVFYSKNFLCSFVSLRLRSLNSHIRSRKCKYTNGLKTTSLFLFIKLLPVVVVWDYAVY